MSIAVSDHPWMVEAECLLHRKRDEARKEARAVHVQSESCQMNSLNRERRRDEAPEKSRVRSRKLSSNSHRFQKEEREMEIEPKSKCGATVSDPEESDSRGSSSRNSSNESRWEWCAPFLLPNTVHGEQATRAVRIDMIH